LSRIPGFHASGQPANPLLRSSMGEGIGNHITLGTHLNPVVPYCTGGSESLFDISKREYVFQILDMMADLMGQDVGHCEIPNGLQSPLQTS